jgi:RND superfamily putative drug exporter
MNGNGVARWGRYAAWGAVALWAGAAAVLVPLASRTDELRSTDPAQVLPRGAEATRALVRERAAFDGAGAAVAVVVYVRDSGITAADRSAVEADRAAFAASSRDSQVGPAVASEDGKALLLSFPIAGDGPQAAPVVRHIKSELTDTPAGLAAAVTGSAGALVDADDAFAGVESTLLLAAAGVVAVLLLVTYRSPVLWLLPLVSVGVASQVAAGLVYLLARYAGVTVTEASSGIMVVLVFGIGTDYALLLVARYREELRRHADRHTAMAVAWRRSLPAILASAATAAVGMLCLLAAQMNDVRGLGPVAAVGIVVALAVASTLLPALLVVFGRWLFWPFVPRYSPTAGDTADQHPGWRRLADAVARRPRMVWAVTTVALVALTSGVFALRLGQPVDRMYTKDVGSVVGQRAVAAHYPSGTSYPARIVATASASDRVVAAASAVSGVATVRPAGTSADGRWVRLDAVLVDPPGSVAAEATVDRLRDAVHAVPAADALVGGQTATTLDVGRAAGRDDLVVMPLILLVVLVGLALLLRALVAALLLVATVVLSFGAAMGLAGLVFRALGHPDVNPTLPLWGYLFLVTLGVDYTIFLMTRAREEVARVGNRQGVLTALTVTGGVVTNAGMVLAATFATLVVLPVVMALHIGLVVALGVLLDTVVVRTLLVPSLAVDLGARIWWPGRPARQRPRPYPSRDALELAA